MYERLTIEQFRGLEHAEFTDLGQLNLITGKNNVGKTAALEALFVHASGPNSFAAVTGTLSTMRGRTALVSPQFALNAARPAWASMFRNFDLSETVTVAARLSGARDITLSFASLPTSSSWQESPVDPLDAGGVGIAPSLGQVVAISDKALELVINEGDTSRKFRCVMALRRGPFGESLGFDVVPSPTGPLVEGVILGETLRSQPQELAQRLSDIRAGGEDGLLLEALRSIDSRIVAIDIEVEYGLPVPALSVGSGRPLPLTLFGSGMVHVVDYLLALNQAKGGIVAIDEIDTGIHYSSMKDVWRAIKSMADLTGSQLFATTHSRECLFAAHEAFADSDVMRLYRMTRGIGEVPAPVQVISYDDDELDAAARVGLRLPLMAIILSPSYPPQDIPVQERTLLLVEGKDDQSMFAAIAMHLTGASLHIRNMGGHNRWQPVVSTLFKSDSVRANVGALGLAQDADDDPDAAWQRCEQLLQSLNFPVPSRDQNVADSGTFKTGIFIAPSVTRNGAVEDLCLDSLVDNPARTLAEDYVAAVMNAGLPPPTHNEKAVVQSFLAVKPRIARTLTAGFLHHEFDIQHAAFDSARSFLTALL